MMGSLWEAGKKVKEHWRHRTEGGFSVPGFLQLLPSQENTFRAVLYSWSQHHLVVFMQI